MAAKISAANDSNLMGAIAYLFTILTGVILYLAKPDDKYVRYHSVQAILLGVAFFVIWLVVGALVGVLGIAIPLLGLIAGFGIMGLVWLAFLLVWLYSMWKAYSGERFKLPVIGQIAEEHS